MRVSIADRKRSSVRIAQFAVLAAAKVKSVTHSVKDKVGSIGTGKLVVRSRAWIELIGAGKPIFEVNVPMVSSSFMSDGGADHAFPRPAE